GATQEIDQVHLYISELMDCQEMALPEASSSMLNYFRNRAASVVRLTQQGNPGPVHVNFPFREPLMPNVQLEYLWGESENPYNKYWAGEREISKSSLEALAKTLNG